MPRHLHGNIDYTSPTANSAVGVKLQPISGMTATNVQNGIEELGSALDSVKYISDKRNVRIMSIANSMQPNEVGEFFITKDNEDYPLALTSVNATNYPIVKITRYLSLAYITVIAVTANGTPYAVNGYTTGSIVVWGQVY